MSVQHNKLKHTYRTTGGNTTLFPRNATDSRVGLVIVNMGTSRIFVATGRQTVTDSDFEFFLDAGGVYERNVEDPSNLTQEEMRFCWDDDAVVGDYVLATEKIRKRDADAPSDLPRADIL